MSHPQPHIDHLLTDRYYLRDEEGNLLESDPQQMYNRVAIVVAKVEPEAGRIAWETRFWNLMNDNKFLPNTPTLINAGKEQGVYAACNVLEIPDSMDGIFDTLKKAAIISKYGGGLGLYFGNLREEGSVVKSTGQTSSGPISFMQVFDAMCNTVKQGGSRRGAMLAALPVWHPDIEKFIACKDDGGFSNFNISVVITDEFMQSVEANEFWEYSNSMRYGVATGIKARDLWNKIVKHAWKTGDPGLIFIDEANRKHPLEQEIKCYNACGEQPLLHGESCVLGSINLMAYIKEKLWHTSQGIQPSGWEFNWDALAEDIPTMVRFLDDIIDASPYPLKEIEDATKASRKIGLGIMGWADCIIKMKILYDSQEALDLAERLMGFIYDEALQASRDLAIEKGSYPLSQHETIEQRNATLLTVAPTGTLSRIAGVSSGIEPIFAWQTHHKLVDLEYDETHWAFTEAIDRYAPIGVCEKLPNYMKIANEISPEWHLKMQAAFQKHVDSSISKTINLPNDADVETVEKIYMWAWKNKLKGITIYRDGSKDNQPLNKILPPLDAGAKDTIIKQPDKKYATGGLIAKEALTFKFDNSDCFPLVPFKVDLKALPEEQQKAVLEDYSLDDMIDKQILRQRGPVSVGVTHKVDTGKGKIYITVNYSEYHSEPVEVFIRLGHLSTPSEAALAEWSGRLLSLLLKWNVPLESIMKQGNKVYSDNVFWYNQKSFCSFPKLISHLLSYTFEEAMEMADMDFDSMLENGTSNYEEETEALDLSGEYCYNCGSYSIIGEAGCKVCTNCSFEECG